MANICDCCGKKNNAWIGDPLYLSGNKLLCCKCANHIQQEMNNLYYAKNDTEFYSLVTIILEKSKQYYTPEIFDAIKETISERKATSGFLSDEEIRKNEQLSKEIQERYDSMIMTTGSLFEGYRVEQYIDIVCVESVFKNSFAKRFSAGMEDVGNMLSFKETEMTGANELISSARKYVLDKFKMKAAKMGANAVLGVDFESSFGSDVVRVAIFGTAVTITKLD